MFYSELDDAPIKWGPAFTPQDLWPMETHDFIGEVLVAIVMS